MTEDKNGIDPERYHDVDVNEDEQVQDLLHGEMIILQKKDGYRFSVDPILLTSFIELKDGEKVMDLGTGSGIMPLILANRQNGKNAEYVGLEVQKEMADMAGRSVTANQMEKNIDIHHGDICKIRENFAADTFDVVISNPPFVPAGKGRVNPNDNKAIARHEIKVTLEKVVEAARYLLKQRGRAYFVYPVQRLMDLLVTCRQNQLEPRQIQFVHANISASAKLALIECVHAVGVGLKVSRAMFVYNMDGTYTEEVAAILNEKDLED